jgi:hypothetical protein
MLFEATDIKFHEQSGNVLVSWPAPQSEDFAIAQYATTVENMENPLRLANTRYCMLFLTLSQYNLTCRKSVYNC